VSASFGEKFRDSAWQALAALVFLAFGILGYIVLQTVARSYYIENESAAGDRIIRTYLVLNPGPWKDRKPTIEFPSSPVGTIIAQSPGVVTEMNSGRLTASPRDPLPPGCAYYIVYEYFRTNNISPEVSVMCDGKPCKRDPSFDMDVILKLHQFAALLLIGFGLLCVLAVVKVTSILARERDHTIRRATETLLANGARSDSEAVEASSATLLAVQMLSKQLQQQAKTKAVTNNKKK
jgi:hypothetical protein